MNFLGAHILRQGVLTPWKHNYKLVKNPTETMQQRVLTPWKHHKYFGFAKI